MPIIREPNYTQYPNVILDECMSQLTHTEFKVISAIIRMTFGYHREHEKVKITAREMMQLTGLTKPTIIKAADSLEKIGLIEKFPEQTGTEWKIVMEGVKNLYPSHDDRGKNPLPLDTKRGKNPLPPTYTRDLLKKKDLKKDQGLEEKTEEDYSFIPDSLQDPEFISAWKEWEVHRKQIKHKLTPLTQKKQLKKLSSVPLKIAIHTIEQSIEKGWQGLFIPKESDPIWQEADMQDTGDSGGEWDMFFEHFDRSKRRDPEPPF